MTSDNPLIKIVKPVALFLVPLLYSSDRGNAMHTMRCFVLACGALLSSTPGMTQTPLERGVAAMEAERFQEVIAILTQARGGSPSAGGGGLAKYRVSALSGGYADVGPDVMAVNYDFDAAGPGGRLVAVTIVNHANTGPGYENLLATRKAAAAGIAGPLQQKSATEFVASGPGCKLRLLPNANTWFINEVYQLPN